MPLPCPVAPTPLNRLLGLRRVAAALVVAALVIGACSGGDAAPTAAPVSYSLPQPRALTIEPPPGMPRYVLALYDSSEGRSPTENETHTAAEFVLNYLGYGVRYLDVDTDPLPGASEMERYAAIVTWFQDGLMRDPRRYIDWLDENVAAGRRYLLLGNVGTFQDAATSEVLPLDEATRPFQLLGARYLGNFTDDPSLITVVEKRPALVEYERPLGSDPLTYEQVVSDDPANDVWLTVNHSGLPSGNSDVVFVSPNGGYIQGQYAFWIDLDTFRRQLRVDLFTFFEQALGRGLWPIPDVTTLNGGRVFYSQIDGDGFRSQYESDGSFLAAEKIIELLEEYPYLVTASVVVFDIDLALFGSPRVERAAQEMFRLDNVESASHGWFHPFDWRRRLTQLPEGLPPDYLESTQTRDTTLQREIPDSVDFINEKLAPASKPVRVFLWTGEANPLDDAISATEQSGVFNLNGGLGRFDNEFDSVSFLVPLIGQPEKDRVQYYATNANDNNYSNLWQGPFEGLKNVLQTFERTEAPRRLTPMDLYYHHFSGSKDAALSALRQVFDWLDRREVTSIWSSEYVASVQGFLQTQITPAGPDRWSVTDYGHMRTVRFDDPSATVDLEQSRDVVGYRRINESLYVSLAEGEDALVVLASDAGPSPHMEYCGCVVRSRSVSGESETYNVEVRLDTAFSFGGLTPGTVVTYQVEGTKPAGGSLAVDGQGSVRFAVPKHSTTVRISGHRR